MVRRPEFVLEMRAILSIFFLPFSLLSLVNWINYCSETNSFLSITRIKDRDYSRNVSSSRRFIKVFISLET